MSRIFLLVDFSQFKTINLQFLSRTFDSEISEYPRKLQLSLGIFGFGISVFIILCGLLVLVRFWVYTNVLYNLFVVSMLITGIAFNVSSINMVLVQVDVI